MRFNDSEIENQKELDKATEIVNTEDTKTEVIRVLKIMSGLSIVSGMLTFSIVTYVMRIAGLIDWSYWIVFAPVIAVVIFALIGAYTYSRSMDQLYED